MAGKWWCCFAAVLGLVCFAVNAEAGHCRSYGVQEVRREVVGYRYVEPVREIRVVERVEVVDDADYYDDYDEEVLEVRRVKNKSANRSEVRRSREKVRVKPARRSSVKTVSRSSTSY